MPSLSLQKWQRDRLARLLQLELQSAATLSVVPPNSALVEENLCGLVVLLSAHFQGYCRDLHTEAAQVIASKVRQSLGLLVQKQFIANRKLDHGNPNLENLHKDYFRFGIDLRPLLTKELANTLRLHHLALLNQWRNVAAHQGTTFPSSGPLAFPAVQAWRNSCDGLAVALDGVVYNQLKKKLRRAPW